MQKYAYKQHVNPDGLNIEVAASVSEPAVTMVKSR